MNTPVYMDNHATTRVDPRVVEAMLPYFTEIYGNAGSTSHSYGWDAQEAVDKARKSIAANIGASPREIVFTSGATESNNLALRGVCERTRLKGKHLISVNTEHKAVLDPLTHLSRRGFEVTLLATEQAGSEHAGWLDPQKVADAIRADTLLVSVMLANNEIGVLQPIAEIAAICKERGVLFHTDATQAVGKIPLRLDQLNIDLMSFSAHKIYGPKGCGALYIRRRSPSVRLESQIDGGGQEGGLRSGTLSVPHIVGFAKALEICVAEIPVETVRLRQMRDRLYKGFCERIPDVTLNGPAFVAAKPHGAQRLANNLNCSFAYVDGEALMMSMRTLAVSSGSACTSANPEPSHVLRAIGLGDDLTRSSLRFGLGRFNTEEEVDYAINILAETVDRLRKMSSIAKH